MNRLVFTLIYQGITHITVLNSYISFKGKTSIMGDILSNTSCDLH